MRLPEIFTLWPNLDIRPSFLITWVTRQQAGWLISAVVPELSDFFFFGWSLKDFTAGWLTPIVRCVVRWPCSGSASAERVFCCQHCKLRSEAL